MANISSEEFLGGGSAKFVGNEQRIQRQEAETNEPSFFNNLFESISTRVDRTGDILERKDSSIAEKGLQIFGQGTGAAADVFEQTVEQVPGVKQVLGAAGATINFLASSAPIKAIGEKIGGQDSVVELTRLYDTDQNFKDSVDAVANIARLGGDVQMAVDAVGLSKNAFNKVKSGVGPSLAGIRQGAGEVATETFALGKKMVPKSPEIMNRVARLTPNQARNFKTLAGETHGEYLTRTGNFGNPQKIVETESIKFAQSIKSVDDTLDTLQGTFKAGVIDDVLEGLTERVNLTSSKNVPSPISKQVSDLVAKNAGEGLTMTDVNVMKRLYEREVKLGYNKMLNPDKVQTATNIDGALREWQVAKAEELGFTNLKELNKQTQISRNLINSLGDELTGKTGLNSVSITDWILLSGGDPTAVGGLIAKKFFGSKGIQSKIAEILSDVAPEGIKKPIVTPSKQVLPPQPKIELKKALPKSSTKPATKSSELSPKGQGKNPTTNSAKEAVKAGLTEEQYVKGQGTPVFHGSDAFSIIEKEGFKKMPIKTGVSAFGEGSYLTTSRANAKGFGGVVKAYLPKNIKLKKVFDSDAYRIDTKQLIKEGFDGVELTTAQGKNITIFNPNQIKTTSQLRAEYQKALKANK